MSVNLHINPLAEKKKKQSRLHFAKMDVRSYAIIAALIAIWILLSFLNDAFLTPRNISNLFLQMSITSILAIGMVLVIVAGQIDLSVGSIVGLTGGVAAILNVWLGWSPILAIIGTILLGALIGLFQGWWVAYRVVPAFIVTLGGMLVFRGILLGISNSTTISPLSPEMTVIGQAYIGNEAGIVMGIICIAALLVSIVLKRASRKKYGFLVEPVYITYMKGIIISLLIFGFVYLLNLYRGIPVPLVFVIVLGILFAFITKNTVFGRQVYAIGGNPDAARLSGINIKRRILLVFVLCNTLAAVAGLILTARLNAATITGGTNYELDAIAACVIGGTSLMGGTGTILGAIIGAFFMATLDNGMSILNLDSYWQNIVKGAILVLAVWVDIYMKKNQKQG